MKRSRQGYQKFPTTPFPTPTPFFFSSFTIQTSHSTHKIYIEKSNPSLVVINFTSSFVLPFVWQPPTNKTFMREMTLRQDNILLHVFVLFVFLKGGGWWFPFFFFFKVWKTQIDATSLSACISMRAGSDRSRLSLASDRTKRQRKKSETTICVKKKKRKKLQQGLALKTRRRARD